MVRESLDRILQQDMLNEGKFARALGAAALGAGLALGHPTDANAQLQNIRYVSEMPKRPDGPSNKISDTLSVNVDSNLGIRLSCISTQTGTAPYLHGSFCLAGDVNYKRAEKTLLDLKNLLVNHTREIVVTDNGRYAKPGMFDDFIIMYDNNKDALVISSKRPHNIPVYLTLQDIEKAIQYLHEKEQYDIEYRKWKKQYDAWERGH